MANGEKVVIVRKINEAARSRIGVLVIPTESAESAERDPFFMKLDPDLHRDDISERDFSPRRWRDRNDIA